MYVNYAKYFKVYKLYLHIKINFQKFRRSEKSVDYCRIELKGTMNAKFSCEIRIFSITVILL